MGGFLNAKLQKKMGALSNGKLIWVVVKIMVPLGVLIMIRPLIFRVPKKGP